MTLGLVAAAAIASLAATAPAQQAEGASRDPWPAEVERLEYPSPADGTLQPTMFWAPDTDTAVPLLVALHTWSGDGRQAAPGAECAHWCIAHGVAFVHPEFRGPNRRPEACGSLLAVQDVLGAVGLARQRARVDPERVYLFGASGGGHAALLLAGRAPELWAGVSAWIPVTDLARWHAEASQSQAARRYAKEIEASCGGKPGASPRVDREYELRSPLTWLAHARGVAIDINTGIRDGHDGSVPIGHAIRAFDVLAAPADRLGESLIARLERTAEVPVELRAEVPDPSYGDKRVLLRRTSGPTRLTVFDGGHEYVIGAALAWLAGQRRGPHDR